jgi:hypothetical protein
MCAEGPKALCLARLVRLDEDRALRDVGIVELAGEIAALGCLFG